MLPLCYPPTRAAPRPGADAVLTRLPERELPNWGRICAGMGRRVGAVLRDRKDMLLPRLARRRLLVRGNVRMTCRNGHGACYLTCKSTAFRKSKKTLSLDKKIVRLYQPNFATVLGIVTIRR